MDLTTGGIIYDQSVVERWPVPVSVSSTTPKPNSSPDQDHETITPSPKRRTQQSKGTPPPPKRQKRSKGHNEGHCKKVFCDPEGLPDPRALPHLHSLFVKLRQTFLKVEIPGESIRLTHGLRRLVNQSKLPSIKESWRLEFQRIATTLNQLLSLDPESSLEPLEHLTLTDLVAVHRCLYVSWSRI